MQRTLLGDWCRCNWVGKKDRCGSHTAHDWSIPRKLDGDFEVFVGEGVDRRDMNGKVLDSVAAFAGSAGLSFRKAAVDATFKFVSDLVDLEISIRHKISPTACTADVLIVYRLRLVNGF
jgi:hypothetical protein